MSDEDAPLRLGYVVQGFARVVPDALVGVGETPEHGRDDGVKVGVRGSREGDGDRGEADEPAFPVVGRRRRDEIVHEGGDECVEVGAKSATVVVAVLLVRSVEHPTSPGCLQPLMFTFVEVEEGLLRWQP